MILQYEKSYCNCSALQHSLGFPIIAQEGLLLTHQWSILQIILLSDTRTIDEGAVTLVRVDLHIALRHCWEEWVLLSCANVAPLMETALGSTQEVMNTLMSIATHLTDTGTICIGYYGYCCIQWRTGKAKTWSYWRCIDLFHGSLLFSYNSHVVTCVSYHRAEFDLSIRSNYRIAP